MLQIAMLGEHMRPGALLRLAVLLAAAVLCNEAAFGQPTWRQVQAKDGSFTVEMPGEPKYSLVEKSPFAWLIGTQFYDLTEPPTYYSIQVTTGSEPPDLRGAVDDAERQLQADRLTWTDIRRTTHQGFNAVDAAGVGEGMTTLRILWVAKGNTLFNLVYVRVGEGGAADADRFINSFRLTK